MTKLLRTLALIGTLEIPEGKVDVTDPCYDSDVWCRMNQVTLEPGTYMCYNIISDEGEWGKRVAELLIVKKELGAQVAITERIGEIGVDAGLAGFFISPKKDYDDAEWSEFCKKLNNYGPTVMLDEHGFFSSSGYGDGGYAVFGHRNKDKTLDALRLVFIPAPAIYKVTYTCGVGVYENKSKEEINGDERVRQFKGPFKVEYWVDEEARDAGLGDYEDLEDEFDLDEAISLADSIYYDTGYASVEVMDEDDNVIYGLYEDLDNNTSVQTEIIEQ